MTKTDKRRRMPPILPTVGLLLTCGLLAMLAQPLVDLISRGGVAVPSPESIRTAAAAVALFAIAHLLHALVSFRLLRPRKGHRPVPKVLLDLLRVGLFLLAALISLSLIFRQDLSGILTGSGLVLAVLGFAIRNVVADVFSGLALGIEAPFRIGDWVRIETLAQGRVLEIGWRTTRLVTRDSTYVILPNSQISRQRITNFSAPRQEYRDYAELTLPPDTSISEVRSMVRLALRNARSLMPERKPEVDVTGYTPEGITYRIKYWVPQHDRETACRNEILSALDRTMRENGIRLASRVAGEFIPKADPLPEAASATPPAAATEGEG